jgi:predicted O-linked N-acetylglucosamine transferase (SPINDLY family)
LRIGYVSPDFGDHVIAKNLLPLFRHHDRTHFEIFCYSGAVQDGQLTAELRQLATAWRSSIGVNDEVLAEIIRHDQVDILVDLSQHLAGNRLTMFCLRPAPVQVSFAGYPASAGVDAIPYRISDRFLESASADQPAEFGWKVPDRPTGQAPPERVFLIDSFWCYDPCSLHAEASDLPAITNGYVTFGSLNHFSKINEPLLKLWARILGAVPNSRLLLLGPPGSHRLATTEFLHRHGVIPDRIEFAERRPQPDFLALHHRLDLILDPYPYGGHSTSLDALWMGVPVVTLAGPSPVSRAGFSQLSNLGLTNLIAHSDDQYLAIATSLATNLPRLADLRRTLRQRMESSALMNAPHFARSIEAAYRAMWRDWCNQPATT